MRQYPQQLKNLTFLFLAILLAFGCEKNRQNNTLITDFIPIDSKLILKINSINSFKSALKSNPLLEKTSIKSLIENNLGSIDSLDISGPLLICSNFDKNNYTFIAKQKHVKNKYLLASKYIKDSVWVFDSSQKGVNENIQNLNHPFISFSKIIKDDATFSIYHEPNDSLKREFLLMDNFMVNISVKPTKISFNGIYTDSKWSKLFYNINPKSVKLDEISSSQDLKIYTFPSFEKFFSNIEKIDSTVVCTELSKNLLSTTNEIGLIKTSFGNAIALHSIDIRTTKDALSISDEIPELYRSTPIFQFENSLLFKSTFGYLFENISASYYSILDDFVIFSENKTVLEEIISNFVNQKTLIKNINYVNLTNELSDEVSYQQTFSPKGLIDFANKFIKNTISQEDLSEYQNSSFQVVRDDNVVHMNGLLQQFNSVDKSKSIDEIFNIKLENKLISSPQFIFNHQSNEKEILIQDVENNLYLISNKGEIRWRKKISGPILGKIQQIDLYKNGKLQMAFVTKNKLYIINILGESVGNFPYKFQNNITKPLAIFDYDNNNNYRFLIVQNTDLIMYDGRGKRVKGFKYNSSEKINSIPKHIRHKNMDYIIFKKGKKIEILNRRGQKRINVLENIEFSDTDIFLYKNMFSTIDLNNNLVQVDLRGKIFKRSLQIEPNSNIIFSEKIILSYWDNYLKIGDNKITLDFGDYGKPVLFDINDKIYISINDRQSNKIWMFDELGNVIPGFPLYGNSTIDLTNANEDEYLEFVTKSIESEIILYRLY